LKVDQSGEKDGYAFSYGNLKHFLSVHLQHVS